MLKIIKLSSLSIIKKLKIDNNKIVKFDISNSNKKLIKKSKKLKKLFKFQILAKSKKNVKK